MLAQAAGAAAARRLTLVAQPSRRHALGCDDAVSEGGRGLRGATARRRRSAARAGGGVGVVVGCGGARSDTGARFHERREACSPFQQPIDDDCRGRHCGRGRVESHGLYSQGGMRREREAEERAEKEPKELNRERPKGLSQRPKIRRIRRRKSLALSRFDNNT